MLSIGRAAKKVAPLLFSGAQERKKYVKSRSAQLFSGAALLFS